MPRQEVSGEPTYCPAFRFSRQNESARTADATKGIDTDSAARSNMSYRCPRVRHGLPTTPPSVSRQSFIALLKNALHPGDTETRTTLTISQSCAPTLLAWSITSFSLA